MFKKKAIQCAGKTKLFYHGAGKKRHAKRNSFLDVLVSYILLFLLTYGCVLIYESVFTVDGSRLSLLCFIGIAEALLFLIYLIPPSGKLAPLWSAGGYLAGFLIFRNTIIPGLRQCGNELVLLINDYYGTDYSGFTEMDQSGSNLAAVCFVTLLFLWCFVTALLYVKNALLLSLPVLLLLCCELLIGMAPGEISVAVTATSLFSLMPYSRGKYIDHRSGVSGIYGKAALILAFILASSFFITLTNSSLRDKAENLAELQSEYLAYQSALEQQLREYVLTGFSNESSGRISNTAPQYEEKDVLSVTTDRVPSESLYLRGYVGDTYRNGNWSNQSRLTFENAVSDLTVKNQNNAGSYILNLFYETQSASTLYTQTQYDINYLDLNDNYAYLPYLTDLNHVYTTGQTLLSLSVNADAMIYRNGQDSLIVNGVTPTYRLYGFYDSSFYSNTAEIENFYSSYLPLYLNVPDSLTQIRQLGLQLSEQLQEYYKYSWSVNEVAGTKEMYAAYLVCDALFSRTSYSLTLDKVPFGKDVVEYFLFDSGKGFCQHYASAGVLLLREMGIPARYVTGYVVDPGDFTQTSDGNYTATVKDSAAHAWVEIYIEHVGWVPVEMTKSSSYPLFIDENTGIEDSSTDSWTEWEDNPQNQEAGDTGQEVLNDGEYTQSNENNTQNNGESTQNNGESPQNNNENLQNNGENLQNSTGNFSGDGGQSSPEDNRQGTNGNNQNPSGSQYPSGGNAESEASENQDGSGQNTPENGGRRILLWIICGIIITAIGCKFCIAKLDHRRSKAFRQRNYRKAIQEIAAYTNRLLRRKGILTRRDLDDQKYREALLKGLSAIPKEELEAYFSVLERAAYSNETLEKADVICCYNIYKKIRYSASSTP